MARTDPQFPLRIPESIKAQIKSEAQKNGRSINAEIVVRLENSFSAETGVCDVILQRLEYLIEKKVGDALLTFTKNNGGQS
ncbi:Arc family DNA-binding protein [Agrobacterium genomosp. 13]|uniref:Regulatory protein mnt n=1 Tax=Agrobacterium genomosp. 13 str. CFBP 6927 TaxID=1183428 RepID=A0ABP2BRL7_9HYPH|nr:Arc family DNA-binding protein [Agrobacterium genomosp. 13]CUX63654.1 putative Regulatory protein mnt [Agrobacterium genomosp. 13 str. CFBP 6927]